MSQRPTVKQTYPEFPVAWNPQTGARAPLKEVYPWTPFAGAYMAPVPESAPTSAITVANQIPVALLANIPADQRNAYVEQWPLMSASERALVSQTYLGTAGIPATDGIPADLLARIPADQRAAYVADWPNLSQAERAVVIQTFAPVAPPVVPSHQTNGSLMQIPADLLASWWVLSPNEQLVVVQTYGVVPQDIVLAWGGLTPDERKVVLETYVPGAHAPVIGAPFHGNVPEAAQAGMGGTALLIAAGVAAWFLLRKK